MKFTIYLYFMLFHFHLTEAQMEGDVLRIVSLIKWIRNYYTTSAVFLVFTLDESQRSNGMIFGNSFALDKKRHT